MSKRLVGGIFFFDLGYEIGRNPVSKHHIFSLSMENEQADAGRDGRARLA